MTARRSPEVTLSVVSHGHGTHINALLADIAGQTIADRIQVLVTQNLEEPYPSVPAELRVDIRKNLRPQGFGWNHNRAFESAESDVFFVVNPDIRLPTKTCLQELLQAVHARGSAIVVPTVKNPLGQREDSVRLNLTPTALMRRVLLRDRRSGDIVATSGRFFWVAGMFMALRQSSYRELRGFDERFFLYCEDYDLCARAYLHGVRIHVESTDVIHDAQRDSHRSIPHLRMHLSSLFKVWCSSAFWSVTFGGGASKAR